MINIWSDFSKSCQVNISFNCEVTVKHASEMIDFHLMLRAQYALFYDLEWSSSAANNQASKQANLKRRLADIIKREIINHWKNAEFFLFLKWKPRKFADLSRFSIPLCYCCCWMKRRREADIKTWMRERILI